MSDKHPTVEEQAETYGLTHFNQSRRKFDIAYNAYLAGHASRNSEVEELKAESDNLRNIIKMLKEVTIVDLHKQLDLMEHRDVAWSQKVEELEEKIQENARTIQKTSEDLQIAKDVLADIAGRYEVGEVAHMLAIGGLTKLQENEGQKGQSC